MFEDKLNIETLLTMTSGQIDLLDIHVLKQFLQILTKEHQTNGNTNKQVDANNNDNDISTLEQNIDQSKHNLIQSLKAQLERYRQE